MEDGGQDSTVSSQLGARTTAYPPLFNPAYTVYRSNVNPPRPMKLAYAACKLIGMPAHTSAEVAFSPSESDSAGPEDAGHLISRLPLSSKYNASSGSNHMRFQESAFPIVLKCPPRTFVTHTHVSPPTPKFCFVAFEPLCAASVVALGGVSTPSGQYTPTTQFLGLCRRGYAIALCMACRDEASASAWSSVGFGSKSLPPRRGSVCCVGSERLMSTDVSEEPS